MSSCLLTLWLGLYTKAYPLDNSEPLINKLLRWSVRMVESAVAFVQFCLMYFIGYPCVGLYSKGSVLDLNDNNQHDAFLKI